MSSFSSATLPAVEVMRTTAQTLKRSVLRRSVATFMPGPEQASKLILALAEESPDRAATARLTMVPLLGMVPLDARTFVGEYVQGRVPFGYYDDPERIYWREFPTRGLITQDSARPSRSMAQQVRKLGLEIQVDTDREQIMCRCRRGDGTWLNDAMIRALVEAADLGLCTTIGTYRDGELVAGEFGLNLSGWYFGMSTFHTISGSGNALFQFVVSQVRDQALFKVVDVGELKPHTARLGAVETTKASFCQQVLRHLASPGRTGSPSAN